MKKGWLIYSKKDIAANESYIDWFIEEAEKEDISLELIVREDLTIGIFANRHNVFHKNRQADMPLFAVVRTIEPLLNLHLEACGISVFNSSLISSICNNKALAHHYLTDLGIPMMNTIFIKAGNTGEMRHPPIPYPFVVKEPMGRGGKQVYLIRNTEDWEAVCHNANSDDIIAQACDVEFGKDVRVFVVGKEIIGAVLRKSTTDFRANFKLGGSAEWYPLKTHEKRMAEKIIQHFDFGMVGIDFLLDKNGLFLFNEIEDVVGSRTLSEVSDINILREYVRHIRNRVIYG